MSRRLFPSLPTIAIAVALALVGCQEAPDGKDSTSSPPTDAPTTPRTDETDETTTPTTDTTTTPTTTTSTGTSAAYPPPTLLQVDCEAVQALRFSCAVTVEPPQPVQIRFFRTDGLGPERIHTSEAVAGDHEIDLYFMAPEQPYTVEATATTWPDQDASIEVTTDAPPASVQSWLDTTGTATTGLIGTHLPCDDLAVAVVYDTSTGDLVWYEELDPNGTLGLLDMVRFTDEHTILGETDGQIVEVDLMGNQIARLEQGVDYEEWLHHDIFKRDGRYYVLYQIGDFGLTLDAVLVLDQSGAELGRWLSDEHLAIPGNAWGDWLHTNTVYVDQNGDILLSFLTQATVVKLAGDPTLPDFGEPRWILAGGPPAGLGSTIDVDWSAIGGADSFGDQHNLHLRNDGRLMLLDNDHGRGLVLTVDETNMTATVDAEYATSESRCGPQGTAMDTTSGNALVGCYGDTIREYDIAGSTPLWEGVVDCQQWGGGFFGNGAARFYPLDGW